MAKKRKPQPKKPAAKLSLKQKLKRVAVAVLALAALAGAVKGGKYVYDGRPHLKVGQCFHDKKNPQIYGMVQAILGDKYQMLLLIEVAPGLMLPAPIEIPVREFNKQADPELIDCKTGEPLEKSNKSAPSSDATK